MARSAIALLLLMAVLAPPAAAQVDADPFYLQRLDAGKLAYASGSHFEAVEELRIAAFGFLDHPALLSETLARLAVAQSAGGMTDEATATLGRFVEVESTANAYRSYDLGSETKSRFESLLKASIPNERLASIDTLRHLHTSEVDRIMSLEGRARTRALEEAREREPGNVRWYVLLARDAIARRSERDARDWIDRGLRVAASERDLVEMKVELQIRDGQCEEAWSTLRALTPLPVVLGERIFLCLADQSRDRAALAVAAALDEAGASFSVAASRARNEIEARQAKGAEPSPPIINDPPPAQQPRKQDPLPPIENQPPKSASPSAETTSESPGTGEPAPPADPADEIARARELVRTGNVAEAKALLLSLPADPTSRDLGLALLEAAVLDRDWPVARRQLGDLTPFRRNESAAIFYASVTLYESGRYDDARRLFQAARAGIADSEYVRRYERLIMGDPER